jgi:hypothetical protein
LIKKQLVDDLNTPDVHVNSIGAIIYEVALSITNLAGRHAEWRIVQRRLLWYVTQLEVLNIVV